MPSRVQWGLPDHGKELSDSKLGPSSKFCEGIPAVTFEPPSPDCPPHQPTMFNPAQPDPNRWFTVHFQHIKPSNSTPDQLHQSNCPTQAAMRSSRVEFSSTPCGLPRPHEFDLMFLPVRRACAGLFQRQYHFSWSQRRYRYCSATTATLSILWPSSSSISRCWMIQPGFDGLCVRMFFFNNC